MEERSMYREAARAARNYRTEVVGRLGPAHESAAVAEWNRGRFWLWAVDRVIEHVEGRVLWVECGRRNFSRIGQHPELEAVIGRIREALSRLAGDSLPGFRVKEELVARIADAANRLLE